MEKPVAFWVARAFREPLWSSAISHWLCRWKLSTSLSFRAEARNLALVTTGQDKL